MTTSLPSDARRVARIVVNTPATLIAVGGAPIEVTVVDISVLGVGILAKSLVEDDLDCYLSMQLPGRKKLEPVKFWGRTAYCYRAKGRYRIGMRFMQMDSRCEQCVQCLAQDSLGCEHACGRTMLWL